MQNEMFILEDFISGSGNITKTYTKRMDYLTIENLGDTDITLSVHDMNIIIKPESRIFDEILNPFTTFTITTSSSYLISVRDNQRT